MLLVIGRQITTAWHMTVSGVNGSRRGQPTTRTRGQGRVALGWDTGVLRRVRTLYHSTANCIVLLGRVGQGRALVV
jgi:hypothetical protein